MKWNETEKQLAKQFDCNGLTIAREDYEDMMTPICTEDLSDDDMQYIIETVYDSLMRDYGYDESDIKTYVEYPESAIPSLSEDFWAEIEAIALRMGCQYYEDME